ncbi:amino acid ABC transporter permease [Pseudomonas typographi]|uniref:Amino acid ABC transporter permease n=1 Tax=Pseudomonas typographi TaxID=2715964 RepID=A0ABR7Z445_9PSED|nr:amino acid ABC transporter permease [Pseudomonas typographi]MBD1552940.1 amino acid ABC transporter permease [Pseudomonas typographi]MBD1588315.1 amino acid ABC transporter permease [Pseudomonas typographi]MBD1600286.1 amino acid ABC transporter permease [Pseudomonas typographi]
MSLELVYQYLVSKPFIHGAWNTLLITICSLFFGVMVGLVIALMQESRSRVAHGATLVYLWLFRGTPVLFQIIFVYNVLPTFGIRFTAIVSAVMALSLNEGAYMAEIIRSGLQAVKKGQRTAGLALGLTPVKVMRHIVVPQAARIILPPIGNQMIGMLKLSALVSVVAVEELLLVANQAASADFRYLEALTAAGIYYLALTTLFMAIQMLIERKLDPKSRRKGRPAGLFERLLGTSRGASVR